jgi:hypothetical protein
MYCPGCGQQQISDQMRFCSRCGLPLAGLAEWLAGGGVPGSRVEQTQVALPSQRQKGMRRGGKLMFLSGVLFFVFLVISLAVGDGGPMIVPFIVFFVGLVLMLYARLFSSPVPSIKTQHDQTFSLGPVPAGGALPPATNTRMYDVAEQRVRTKELAHPPSVTEHTTKLLDKD